MAKALLFAACLFCFFAGTAVYSQEPTIVTVAPVSVQEGHQGTADAVFSARLSRPIDSAVKLTYRTVDFTATAGEDYLAAQGTLTLSPGDTEATVTVQILGDRLVEGSESFFLEMECSPNARMKESRALGVVLTDDLGPHGGIIAFDFQRPWERSQSIYVMNADGSRLTRLTSGMQLDRVPVFSPDGSRIVFESRRDGNPELYVMNADGSDPIRITRHPAVDSYGRFSPDGKQVAFFSNRTGDYNVYIAAADGSGVPRQLTKDKADDFDPCFSADGRWVCFPSTRDGDLDIYAINIDGTNLRKLTDTEASEHYPSVSPDGQSITFRTNRDGQYEVYRMDADGANPTRVTQTAGSERHSSYTPDGKRIAFHRFEDFGRSALCVIDADGRNRRDLRDASAANLNISWGPGQVSDAGPFYASPGVLGQLNALNRRYVAKRTAYVAAAIALAGLVFWALRRRRLSAPKPASLLSGEAADHLSDAA